MAFLKLGPGLKYGQLPFTLLERSTLSTPARLLWGILYGFGEQSFPSVPYLALLLGFKPKSKNTVRRYLSELEGGGFLISTPGPVGQPNNLTLILPDFAAVQDLDISEIAHKALQSPQKTLGKSRSRRRGGRPQMTAQARFKYLRERARPAVPKAAQVVPPPPVSGETPPGLTGDPPRSQVGPPPVSGETPKRVLEFESFRGGSDTLPQAPLLDTLGAPAGWEDWGGPGGIYETETGKPWIWTNRDVAAAIALGQVLGAAFLPHVKLNFARNRYHADRGCQLNKLLDNLNEFLPTRAQLAAPRATRPEQGSQLPNPPALNDIEQRRAQVYDQALADGLSVTEAFRRISTVIS